jgi:hypothetical protein
MYSLDLDNLHEHVRYGASDPHLEAGLHAELVVVDAKLVPGGATP